MTQSQLTARLPRVIRPALAMVSLSVAMFAVAASPASATATACAGTASPMTRVGNAVFIDSDDDGLFDPGESGVDGVIVELWLDADDDEIFEPSGDDGGAPTCTTTTSGGGRYWFHDIDPDQYFVAIAAAPAGHRSSTGATATVGADHTDDGDPLGSYASVSSLVDLTVALPTTEVAPDGVADDEAAADVATNPSTFPDTFSDLTIDFGFTPIPCLGIGNRVWQDLDDDGAFDTGETGIDGVSLELFASDGSGAPIGTARATAVTSDGGYYLFPCNDEGDYVAVVSATNFDAGGPLAGLRSSVDGTAATDQQDDGIDPTTTGDRVVSRMVTLVDGAQPTGEPDKPAGTAWNFDAPTDVANDTTIDFGFAAIPDPLTSSLGDYVWIDANDDGVQNAGETPVGGVTLLLLDDAGTQLASTTTASDGSYRFGNLAAGTYTVCFLPSTLPAGMVGTTIDTGGDDSVDSDFDGAACAAPVALGTGTSLLTLDLGITSSNVDLSVTKSGSWSATDEEITWSIVVRNLGTETEPGSIIITDILPTGLGTPVITAPSGMSCNYAIDTRQITCTSTSPLPGGATLALSFVTPKQPSSQCSISNTVTVRGAGVDATSANNVASTTVDTVCTTTTTTTTTPTLPKTGGTILLVSLAALLTTTGQTLVSKSRR